MVVTTQHITHNKGCTCVASVAVAPGTDANDVNAGNVADIGANVPEDFHGSIILNGISEVSEHK